MTEPAAPPSTLRARLDDAAGRRGHYDSAGQWQNDGALLREASAVIVDYERLRDQIEHQEGGIGDAEIRALVADRDALRARLARYEELEKAARNAATVLVVECDCQPHPNGAHEGDCNFTAMNLLHDALGWPREAEYAALDTEVTDDAPSEDGPYTVSPANPVGTCSTCSRITEWNGGICAVCGTQMGWPAALDTEVTEK